MGRSVRLIDLAISGGVAVSAWVFADTRSAGLAVVTALAGASGLMWRRPVWALSLALVAIWVARGPIALSASDSWNVALAFVVAASLGAFAPVWVAGVGVLTLAVSIAWTRDVTVLDLMWVGVNLAGVAVLSAIAARACRRAVRETARAGRLASGTPQDAARRAVAEERLRLAKDVHQVIRTSVVAMRDEAAAAAMARTPDVRLRAVQREGRKAIAELRRLLGLLRDPSPHDQDLTAAAAPAATARWPSWRLAVAESAGMCVIALLEPALWRAVAPDDASPPIEGFWPVAFTVIAAGLVGVRRLAPSVTAAAFGGLLLLSTILSVRIDVGLWVVWAIGLITWAAAYHQTIASACGLAVLLLTAAAAFVLMPETAPWIIIMIVVVVAGMAYLTSRHRMLAGSAGEMADRLTIERSQASAEAVHAERLTVARELHDVVSHAVVVMVVQAGAAEALMGSDPAAADQALAIIDQTAASALEELDRLLAAIDPKSTGMPGEAARLVTDLRDLAERMRVGGLNVRLLCTASDDAGVDPIVYRIVQETLTNALRHAPTARVTVDVRTDETGTTVEVIDDGPGPGSESRRGYGLVGVTERVQHVGGVVEIGQPSSASGGFRVFARLPAARCVVMTTIRVLLVDDQDLVRGGLAAILSTDQSIEVVGQASDGPTAVQMAGTLAADVVLMDIEMPGGDGIQATKRILETCPATRVLMLTTFDLDEYVYQALRAGASGFLLKTTPPAHLANAVRACAQGETLLSPSVTRQLIETFVQRPAPAPRRMQTSHLDGLTPRELDVLTAVAAGKSNSEISHDLFLSEATIKTHITHILAKLGLRDRVQAVVLAYEAGLVKPNSQTH